MRRGLVLGRGAAAPLMEAAERSLGGMGDLRYLCGG